jgi:hypothetical protein
MSTIAQQVSVFEYTPLEGDETLNYDTQETSSATKASCDLNVQIGSAPSAINTVPFLSPTPPFRIRNPGQYCLTIDVTVPAGTNGIVIESSDVSINLNGKSFTGSTGSGFGILVSGLNRSNIVIENGTIASMGSNGIHYVNGGEQVTLRNLKLIRNGIGLNLSGIRNFTIENCLVTLHRAQGIVLSNFGTTSIQSGVISNCFLSFNGLSGLQITQGQNLILQNIVSLSNGNPGNGIQETNGNRIIFDSCVTNNNAQSGIFSSGIGNSFSNCIANNNGAAGFTLNGNRLNINDAQAKGNTTHGFAMSGANATVTGCSSKDNSQNGFLITGNHNSFEQCDAIGNASGFNVSNTNHCLLNCVAKINSSFGFLLQPNSAQCQVRSNTAVDNGTAGFQNNTTTVNYIYSNFASNNGTPPATAANFVGILNVFTSPVPADPINFTTNISN